MAAGKHKVGIGEPGNFKQVEVSPAQYIPATRFTSQNKRPFKSVDELNDVLIQARQPQVSPAAMQM